MKKKFKAIIYAQLMQGVSPRGLALTCAVGGVLGCMPVLGITSILCFIIAYKFKLNQPLLQVINYSLTPIHLLMVPVFLSVGQIFATGPSPSFNPKIFVPLLFSKPAEFLSEYGLAFLLAILSWLIVSPVLGFVIYQVSHKIFIKIYKQIENNKT